MEPLVENKIEYQLSPELVEKLAIEQAMINVPSLRKFRWKFPVCAGILGAALLFTVTSLLQIRGAGYSTMNRVVSMVVVFCLGFAAGRFFLIRVRVRVCNNIKKRANAQQEKLGTARTVSWDAEWITLSTSGSKNQIKWQTVDEVRDASVAIHLISSGRSILLIPKSVLPQNMSADDLLKTWRSYLAEPPVTS